jgi:NAD(P)-dependent dehydrogenase (short-subunit alcohol dehydrogenase family)
MPDTTIHRVIVITGASAGVGRATAQAFAGPGVRLGLIARGVDGLEAARRDVVERGGAALAISADVADHAAMQAAADRIERELGPIDVWVNNAMASVFSPFHEIEPEEFRRVTEVTYLGCVHGTMAAIARMRPRNRGVIVQVGSALAYRAIPLQSAYCGAKHAVEGFTESLRCELGHERSRIRLTMVQLPALNTPQFRWVKSRLPNKPQPVPPIFQPEVAAEAIVWAADRAPRELLVGLSTVVAVVGNRFFAGLGDRYLAKTGFRAQQTSQADDHGRPSNLWHPVPGDAGAHGDFDAQAHARSPGLWVATHIGWGRLVAVVMLLIAIVGIVGAER